MTTPAVSVIIPTYNRSWGLRRAVGSVLAQTFLDFELIITDDASVDDTPEVVRSFADPRVRYYRQSHNVGVSRNWGTGVELAHGEFVALLMDDDRYEPKFLARRVAALRAHPGSSFAFSSGYRVVDRTGVIVKNHLPRWKPGLISGKELVAAALARDCFIGATLYRASILRLIWPASESAGIVRDYATNLLLAVRPAASAVYLDGADLLMAVHPGQLSRTRTDEAFRETVGVLDRLLAEPLPPAIRRLVLREAASWHVVGGRAAAAAGRRWEAVRRLIKAARLSPLSRGPWTQLARTVTGL